MRNNSVIASEHRELGNPKSKWIASSLASRNDVFLLVLLLLFFAFPAFAFQYEVPLQDSAKESTAHEIFTLVRCLVCDGESLASSSADYSVSMRAIIREQLASGQSKEQVISYLTERYGEGVLQAPPKQGSSLILWLSPIALIFFGLIFMRRKV